MPTTSSSSTSAASACPSRSSARTPPPPTTLDASRMQVPAERDAAAEAAQTFVTSCIAETGVDEADLPLYATTQAVEDLEAVRDYLDVDKMELYGESYGTQFVQTYAAAHPDHVAHAVSSTGRSTSPSTASPITRRRPARAEDTLVATLTDCTDRHDVCAPTSRAATPWPPTTPSRPRPSRTAPISYRVPEGRRARPRPREFTDRRSRERRLLLASTSPGDRDPVPASDRGRVAGRTSRPARPAGVRRDRRRSGDARRRGRRPDLLGRAVLRGRVPGLRVLPGTGRRATPAIDAWLAAGEDAGIDDASTGDRLLRRPAVHLLAERADDTETRPAPITDPPYPVFVLDVHDGPGDADRQRRCGSTRRLTDAWFVPDGGRSARHLRLGRVVARTTS